MNYYKDKNGSVFYYTDDQLELDSIKARIADGEMVAMTDAEVTEHLNPVIAFDLLKQNKVTEINTAAQKEADALTEGYPEFERLSWSTQQQEAVAWFSTAEADRTEALCSWCSKAASARGIALSDFMKLVQSNVNAFIQASSSIAGKRQKLVDQINAIIEDTEANRNSIGAIAW